MAENADEPSRTRPAGSTTTSGTPTGRESERLNSLGKKVYPTLAGCSQNEKQALEDLTELASLNYTIFNTPIHSKDWTERIHSILQAVVDIICRGTGAATYAFSTWDAGEEGTYMTDVASDTIAKLVDRRLVFSVREVLLRYMFEEVGSSFTRNWRKAWPTIYGLPKDDYRPRLPPRHANWKEELFQLLNFIIHLAEWQGHFAAIEWQEFHDDIRHRRYQLVEKKRLPCGFDYFPAEQCDWTAELVYALTGWIRSHQARLDAGDTAAEATAFQLAHLSDKKGDVYQNVATYQKQIGPDSVMRYSTASAFYFATLRQQSRSCSQSRELERLAELGGQQPYLQRLSGLVAKYCRYQAPEVAVSEDNLPNLLKITRTDASSMRTLLDNFKLPDPFFGFEAQQSDAWSVRRFSDWVKKGGALDPSSGLLMGGANGVFRVYVTLVRLYHNIHLPISPDANDEDDLWHYGENENRFVKKAAEHLQSELERCIVALINTTGPDATSPAASEYWVPSKLTWWSPEQQETIEWNWSGEVPEKSCDLSSSSTDEEAPQRQTVNDGSVEGEPEAQSSMRPVIDSDDVHMHTYGSESDGEGIPESSKIKITRTPNAATDVEETTELVSPVMKGLPALPVGELKLSYLSAQDGRRTLSDRLSPKPLPNAPASSTTRRGSSVPLVGRNLQGRPGVGSSEAPPSPLGGNQRPIVGKQYLNLFKEQDSLILDESGTRGRSLNRRDERNSAVYLPRPADLSVSLADSNAPAAPRVREGTLPKPVPRPEGIAVASGPKPPASKPGPAGPFEGPSGAGPAGSLSILQQAMEFQESQLKQTTTEPDGPPPRKKAPKRSRGADQGSQGGKKSKSRSASTGASRENA